MVAVTRWWLVRHAPVINPDRLIYGQHDIDCDVSDERVFASVARHLPKDAVWLQSPLGRTRKTAEALRRAGATGDPAIDEPRLMEQCFGDWQGMDRETVRSRHPEAYRRFWLAPADERAPGGESFLDVVARVSSALEEWCGRLPDRDIVAVMHGGSIRASLVHALGIAPATALSFHVDTVSMSRVDIYADGQAGIAFINATPWRS